VLVTPWFLKTLAALRADLKQIMPTKLATLSLFLDNEQLCARLRGDQSG